MIEACIRIETVPVQASGMSFSITGQPLQAGGDRHYRSRIDLMALFRVSIGAD